MKKFILLLLLATVLPLFSFSEMFQISLTGKWKATSANSSIDYLIFDKEGYAAMQNGNEIIGGKDIGDGKQRGKMTYSTNFNVKPAQIDFILTRLDTKQEMRLKGIIEVINNNEIKVAINDDPTVRPKSFDASAMVFKRVE